MIWGATTIAPLKPDFSGFSATPVDIKPSGDTARTINRRGTTLAPLNVETRDGELYIRAKDPAYANPGPDEAQKFE